MEKLGLRLDKIWVGLLAGIAGPWLGAFIFYLITYAPRSILVFAYNIQHNPSTHSAFISVSLVFNLVFFLGALRYDWYAAARGVIMAVFIYAPFVIFFKYVA